MEPGKCLRQKKIRRYSHEKFIYKSQIQNSLKLHALFLDASSGRPKNTPDTQGPINWSTVSSRFRSKNKSGEAFLLSSTINRGPAVSQWARDDTSKVPSAIDTSNLTEQTATTWSRSAGHTFSQPSPSPPSTFESTSLHIHSTTIPRCLPLANLVCHRFFGNSLIPQILHSINTPNPDRKDRPAIFVRTPQGQVREIRRLCDTLTSPLHDTR